MSLTTDRLLVSSILFILTLLVGTVPVYLFQLWTRRRSMRTIVITTSASNRSLLSANFYVQIVTQIGGGILFYTVFVHMIPEIREHFEEYRKRNDSIFIGPKSELFQTIEDLNLPYLELTICFGFFAIYLAEVFMHSLLESHESNDSLKEEVYDFDKKSDISTIESESSAGQLAKDDEPVLIAIRCHKSKCDLSTHPHNYVRTEPLIVRFLHGLVIITAFSIHSIFDGISIGVRTEWSEMWTMFIAIASHKLMIALIIGVELYEKCANFLLVVFHMFLFSIMAPIGILAIVWTQNTTDIEDESNPIIILLSAIASGTILYIVFFEILQKERVSKLKPIIQYISLSVGFGLMFCVTITLRED